ncbi:MAG TPA: DUF2970 domain-containing protein [Halomonas sp.]|nr:DUF2970 domain-containing protein [Halomonas sp.]
MWRVVKSILAALFGVQKDAQRREDFETGHPVAFIAVGILVGLVFVAVVAGVAMLAAR